MATMKIMKKACDAAQKITDWFPPAVKPVHVGAYEVADADMLDSEVHGFQYWNGSFWGIFEITAKMAQLGREHHSTFQNHHWRGLAFDPAKGAGGQP
jgi:hypothetical protein